MPSLIDRDDAVDNEVGVDMLMLRDRDLDETVEGGSEIGRGISSGLIPSSSSSSLIMLGMVGAYKLSTSASLAFSGSKHLHSAV